MISVTVELEVSCCNDCPFFQRQYTLSWSVEGAYIVDFLCAKACQTIFSGPSHLENKPAAIPSFCPFRKKIEV